MRKKSLNSAEFRDFFLLSRGTLARQKVIFPTRMSSEKYWIGGVTRLTLGEGVWIIDVGLEYGRASHGKSGRRGEECGINIRERSGEHGLDGRDTQGS